MTDPRSAYAAAMARDAERLEAARKRSIHEASVHGEAHDDVETAWDSVFEAQKSAAGPSEAEEARRRKLARKAEKRAEKRANENANAGSWSVYISGVPKEISYTAVHNLFSKAGDVRKVKLYKDESGEPKGDGLVTFGSEAAAKTALEPGRDWALFGEPLTVSPATFHERPAVTQADWSRIVILCHMATQEQVAASADMKGFVSGLEEEVWLECGKHGRIERVQCFPADPACAVAVRFEASAAAAACVEAMNGRFYDGRSIDADVYDGHRKRALPEGLDVERAFRLGSLVEERQAAILAREEEARTAAAAAAEAEAERVAAAAAAEAVAAGEAAARGAAAAAARVALPEKTYVKIRGLLSRPESNGSVGVIVGRDEASGRYTVRLRDGSALALKLANLLQMAEVRLVGLEGELAPHEGALATVFEREDEAEMYGVELQGGQSVAVGFSQVLVPDGAHGVVAGLQSASQYNGLAARVLEYDAASGRYLALVDGGKQLRLRRQNLRL